MFNLNIYSTVKDENRPATKRRSKSEVMKVVDPLFILPPTFYRYLFCHITQIKISFVGTINKIRRQNLCSRVIILESFCKRKVIATNNNFHRLPE